MDYSFIRFEDSFTKANDIKNSPLSTIILNEAIQLLPTEPYLQKTNQKNGLAFDNNYKCEIIDCSQNVLADITDYFFIYEFTDRFGVNQIQWELAPCGLDFNKKPIHLKLTHTTGDEIYYSNSFYLTDYQVHKTVRFDYRHNGYFKGIHDDITETYQSIRLQTWFTNFKNPTEFNEYYQISSGITRSFRPLYKQTETYKADFINNFVFERLNILFLLDNVYIDGIKITNKPKLDDGENIGDTNYFKSGFECFKNYDDTYQYQFQIIPDFYIISKLPSGNFSPLNIPSNHFSIYSHNISNIELFELRNYEDDVLVDDLSDTVFNLNEISGSVQVLPVGKYYFVIKVTSVYGQVLEITDKDIWNFTIRNADYSSSDYNTNDYFTF